MSGTKFQNVSGDADRVTQSTHDAAQAAGSALRDATGVARDAAYRINETVSRQTDRAVEDLSRRVEEQPITALLVAGGIGLVAGMLLARR